MKYLITGHGKYASGTKSSLELLLGNVDDIYAIDFDGSNFENLSKLYEELVLTIDEELVIIVDLIGGTPFNKVYEIVCNNSKVRIVCGISILAILQTYYSKDNMNVEELAKLLVSTTKDTVSVFEEVNIVDNGDGI